MPVMLLGRFSIHELSGKITIDGNITTGMIRIGDINIGIADKNARTVLNIHGNIKFNGKASIGRGSKISAGKNASIEFGNNFNITAASTLIASDSKKVTFGNDCLISWDVQIMNTDFHGVYNLENNERINLSKDIIIGNNVWIGCRCLILKGAQIPDNSVIGANSLLSHSVHEKNCIYAGSPAKKIKENIFWKK